jgi:hypothetical protein
LAVQWLGCTPMVELVDLRELSRQSPLNVLE